MERLASIHQSVHGDGNDILGRIVVTCEEMLRDRGCTLVVRADDPLAAYDAGTPPMVWGEGEGVLRHEVYVHKEEKVGVKFARQVLHEEEDGNEKVKILVVSPDGPTPFTRKECEGKPIQFFLARDLCVNVTHHALVPKHQRVDAQECPWDASTLPRILDTDPVVQYYDWPLGTVVRVWRRFGGHETTPYFRVVSAASS